MEKRRELPLEVHQLDVDDVLQSIIRFDRHLIDELQLRLHGLCEVQLSETEKKVRVQVRSIESRHRISRRSDRPPEEWILLDEELRNRLGAKTGALHGFCFRPIRWYNILNGLRFLVEHENPKVRITAWLSIASVLVGVAIGLLPFLIQSVGDLVLSSNWQPNVAA